MFDSVLDRISVTPDMLNQARYRALLQSVSTFVWVASPSGDFTFPQQAWEDYTGQTFERHRGSGWIAAVHPDDRPHVSRAWSEAVAAHSWYEVEWRCWHCLTATWRRCVTRGIPILSPEAEVIEWIGAVTDVDPLSTHTS